MVKNKVLIAFFVALFALALAAMVFGQEIGGKRAVFAGAGVDLPEAPTKIMFTRDPTLDHFLDAYDDDQADADVVYELGTGGDAEEWAWALIDSTSTGSSVWIDNSGRWQASYIRTAVDDWNITDSAYPRLILTYIDWLKYIPAGATILSAELHLVTRGTWYVGYRDSMSATLMTIEGDSLWYSEKGTVSGSDAAPNLSYANWSHQIAGLNTAGYPELDGGAWSPSLADRPAFDDWGNISDWSGYRDGDTVIDSEIIFDIKNCVQYAVNGATNNGIMFSGKDSAGEQQYTITTIEPRPGSTLPESKVPWFTVTYSNRNYQKPYPDGEFAFIFTTDDGRVEANTAYGDVFDEFGWNYTAYIAKVHDPDMEWALASRAQGNEIGTHSVKHLPGYGIANWDCQEGFQGAEWDSLIRDTRPEWLYALADSADGNSRESDPYFGKTFGTPTNHIDQEGMVALVQHGYSGFRCGRERRTTTSILPGMYREMDFRAAISDSLRCGPIPHDPLREQNMMGVPTTVGADQLAGGKSNTTITEAEVKWNTRRHILQVLANKTKVVSIFTHDLKTGATYDDGVDAEELRWILEVVQEMGGVAMRLTDFVNWKKANSKPCATPVAYAQTDSMSFVPNDNVWFKPIAGSRLYPYEEAQ